MSFDVGAVVARIKADLTEFTQGMEQAKAEASSMGGSVQNTFSQIKDFAAQAGAVVAAQSVAFGLLGKQAIDVASNFEQTQVSFGTLLGSEQKAADLMKEIMQFELHTPFDIQTLTNAAKNLLAFGVSADQVVPKIKMLTDMSQGQSARLTELVSIYGQVNSIQALNGREVLRLSSIGIPIYQALADHFNKMGGAATKAGAAVSASTEVQVKGHKMSAEAMTAANDRLSEMNVKLKILEEQHPKTGIATEKHALQIMTLKNHIAETTSKISDHTVKIGGMGVATKITGDQVRQMISDHKISIETFDSVLKELTGKGGLFFEENIRQMSTYSGIVSSIKSQIQYAILNIMGIDLGAANEVRKGGLFEALRNGAANVLDWLHKLQPLFNELGQNKTFKLAIEGFVVALVSLSVIIPIVLIALNPVVLAVFAIEAAIVALYVAWNTNFLGIRDITGVIVNGIKAFIDTVLRPTISGVTSFFRSNFGDMAMIVQSAWALIKSTVTAAVGVLYLTLKEFIEGAVRFWNQYGTQIIEGTRGAWEIIKGIIMLVLGVLTAVIGFFLNAMMGKWDEAWKSVFTGTATALKGIENIINGFVNIIKGWGGAILQALVQPFEDAWNRISATVQKIKDSLDFTKRHSPSVIDIVEMGVAKVNDALNGLNFNGAFNVSPQEAFSGVMQNIQPMQGTTIHINLDGAVIADAASASRIGEVIGDAMINKLKLNIRI